jgi:diphthine-ammonia ligase
LNPLHHSAPALACSWSGGKDSCYALMRRLQLGGVVKVLINMMNEEGKISRSHGLPKEILEMQSLRLGIPVLHACTGWSDYEKHFISLLQQSKREYMVEEIVFGDIDLQAHRDWEEMVCMKSGVTASLPLWKQDRKELVLQMLNAGIETTIVSCNDLMGQEFIGRELSLPLVEELESMSIDPCGENGEFHTVVTSCPLFSSPIILPALTPVQHEGYWFSRFEGF